MTDKTLAKYIASLKEWDRKAPVNLSSFLDRLRKRYGEPVIPPCRLCGSELSLHAAGPTGTTWYCDGKAPDGSWQPGRKVIDDHFSASVHREYRTGDADVIALIDAYVRAIGATP